jgi:signal transduction histidine kinase
MPRSAAFQHRLRLGFAVALMLTLFIGGVSLYSLRFVIGVKDDVITQHTRRMIALQQLRLASERDVSDSRAFLLTMDERFLHRTQEDRQEFREILDTIYHLDSNDEDRVYLDRIRVNHDRYVMNADQAIVFKQQGRDPEFLVSILEQKVLPEWGALKTSSDKFLARLESQLIQATEAAGGAARRTTLFVALSGAGALVLAAGVFLLASRALSGLAWADHELRDLNEGLEQRVRERTARLDESLRELDAFSYTVAHDLRAPLRAMAGFSQLLLEDCEGRGCETCQDYKRRIEESARRMDRLVQDLLAYSRLTRSEFKLAPVALSKVVNQATSSLLSWFQQQGAEVGIADPLPSVLGHEMLLVQVFENLLSNAVKFVAPGVRPRVSIRAEQKEGIVRVWVEDNGIGIPTEYYDRVFGVFERLNRPEEYPGTGIGLAIVRRAVQRMEGRTGFDSQVGQGSRFWVELSAAA